MADSGFKYVGVDGCKAGWIGVGLDDGESVCVNVREKFSEILECFGDARIVLVDMPIGLPKDGKPTLRACDEQAQDLLEERKQSVFRVPSKEFVEEVMTNQDWGYRNDPNMKYRERYRKANERSQELYKGAGIASQTFGIIPKIYEVDEALHLAENDSREVREAHPEVCFWALNKSLKGERRLARKQESLGFGQRLQIVSHCVGNAADIFRKVPRHKGKGSPLVEPDDVLDALALAITAKIGWRKGFSRLPKDLSPDRKKPPEMVYAIPNEGTPC